MPRKSQFNEEQIIRALKEADAGARATDVCRKLGVSEQTFYRWKAKYGGMDVIRNRLERDPAVGS